MEKAELKIKTRQANCKEEEIGGEPVSPTGQYFNSSVLSISVLCVLESQVPIDDSQAMALLQNVFLPINPRFSSIMVIDNNGVKQWKKVEVKLQDHFNIPIFPPGLSSECNDDHFNNYLTKIAMDPLPQNRPLWEIHLVKYPTSKAAGHLIFKLHHALGDGFSLMGALLSCLQRADDPSLPLTFPTFPLKSKSSGYYTNIIRSIPKAISVAYNTLCDYGWGILKSSLVEDSKTPIRSANEDVEYNPVKICTVEFSLEQIKQIKVALGVTINDVIAGIICYGTRLYMKGRSENCTGSHSTALVLLNTRNTGGYKSVPEMLRSNTGNETSWGNQFAFLHSAVPEFSGDESLDPLKFIFEAKKIIQRKRSSLAIYFTGQTLEIIRKCAGPEAAAQFIHTTLKNSSMTISNMIGPVERMALANHPVKGLYFMVVGVPQSLTITVLSYMQTLRIAIGVEKRFIDLQEFSSCIEKAFELTLNTATKNG